MGITWIDFNIFMIFFRITSLFIKFLLNFIEKFVFNHFMTYKIAANVVFIDLSLFKSIY